MMLGLEEGAADVSGLSLFDVPCDDVALRLDGCWKSNSAWSTESWAVCLSPPAACQQPREFVKQQSTCGCPTCSRERSKRQSHFEEPKFCTADKTHFFEIHFLVTGFTTVRTIHFHLQISPLGRTKNLKMTADAPDDVHAARTAGRHSASVRLGQKLLPSCCGVRLPRETYKSIRRVIQTRFVHWP